MWRNSAGRFIHYHADGTARVVGPALFGDGLDFLGIATLSEFMGTWRRSGARELRGLGLAFGYDAEGVVIWIARTDWTATFAEDFSTGQFHGATWKLYTPDQDPLDPAAVPQDIFNLNDRRVIVP